MLQVVADGKVFVCSQILDSLIRFDKRRLRQGDKDVEFYAAVATEVSVHKVSRDIKFCLAVGTFDSALHGLVSCRFVVMIF